MITTSTQYNNPKTGPIIDLLQRLIGEIILRPGELKITATEMTRSAVIHVGASRGDAGRIIGSKGSHFKAFSAIVAAYGEMISYRMKLDKITEPSTGTPDRYPDFEAKTDWPRDNIVKLLEDALGLCGYRSFETKVVDSGISTSIDVIMHDGSKAVVDDILPHFQELFKAIGRANGRELFLDMILDSDPQPAHAGGRFTPEV